MSSNATPIITMMMPTLTVLVVIIVAFPSSTKCNYTAHYGFRLPRMMSCHITTVATTNTPSHHPSSEKGTVGKGEGNRMDTGLGA